MGFCPFFVNSIFGFFFVGFVVQKKGAGFRGQGVGGKTSLQLTVYRGRVNILEAGYMMHDAGQKHLALLINY